MTKFNFLCSHSGNYDFTDKKSGKHFSGLAYYLIVVKDGDCFPMVKKCTEDVYKEALSFKKDQKLNLYFDENQRISGVNVI